MRSKAVAQNVYVSGVSTPGTASPTLPVVHHESSLEGRWIQLTAACPVFAKWGMSVVRVLFREFGERFGSRRRYPFGDDELAVLIEMHASLAGDGK